MKSIAGILAVCGLIGSAFASGAPVFTVLGNGQAQAITNDGSIVSGANGTTIWTWTSATGLVNVPANVGRAAVISANGNVLAGVSNDANGNRIQCFQPYPANGAPWQFLTPLTNASCTNSTLGPQVCVSGDGSVVGGYLPRGGCTGLDVGVTWTATGGEVEWYSPFGTTTRILAISEDGTAFMGTHYMGIEGAFSHHGCIWYSDGTFEPVSTELFHGTLGAINRDGSMVAGNSHPTTYNAYTWTAAGGFHDLGPVLDWADGYNFRTSDMTDDGRIVIGTGTDGATFSTGPVIWFDGAGGRVLKTYLIEQGVTGIDTYTFVSAAAITPDGRYIIGSMRTPTSGFGQVAYLIDLGDGSAPCPADFNQDGGVDGADVEAFFAVWESGAPGADVNQDGGIDGSDVQTFFSAWEAGGCN